MLQILGCPFNIFLKQINFLIKKKEINNEPRVEIKWNLKNKSKEDMKK